jgi:excisionase family DNA binding protein
VSVDTLDRCLTVSELAQRWRCRVATVRAMVKSGSLAAIRINGTVRIAPEAIREAEQGSLAVRTPRRRRRETIDPEIQRLLE